MLAPVQPVSTNIPHASCPVCTPMSPCKHRTRVGDGEVERVECPDPTCRKPVPPSVLRGLLSEQEFMRWETLLLQRTLDKVGGPSCPTLSLPVGPFERAWQDHGSKKV